MSNILSDLYGSKQQNTKTELWVGLVFAASSAVLTWLSFLATDFLGIIFYAYLASLLSACSLFSFSSYFFAKSETKHKYKKLKYVVFTLSLLFLGIVFSPISLFVFVTTKISFLENFLRHGEKYILALCLPLILSLILGVVLYDWLLNFPILNASTIAILCAFLIWRQGSLCILNRYHSQRKKPLNDREYLMIKKDFTVSVFLMITFVAILTNCLNLPTPYDNLVKSFSNAFAIYIAVDRLLGKWEKATAEVSEHLSNK